MARIVGTVAGAWFIDFTNLVSLADYMADHGSSAREVADMLEKPWKCEDEWQDYVRELETQR